MRAMAGLNALRAHDRITWIEEEQGWLATPEDVMDVLSSAGFEECKRETTTSRPDRHPAGGLWQGINPGTGSVASAIWVMDVAGQPARVFVEVDGQLLAGGFGRASRAFALVPRAEPDPSQDEGGES